MYTILDMVLLDVKVWKMVEDNLYLQAQVLNKGTQKLLIQAAKFPTPLLHICRIRMYVFSMYCCVCVFSIVYIGFTYLFPLPKHNFLDLIKLHTQFILLSVTKYNHLAMQVIGTLDTGQNF